MKGRDRKLSLLGASVLLFALTACVIKYAAFPGGFLGSRDSSCTFRLVEMCKALQEYKSIHGAFPPAQMSDGAKAVYSWRLPILPYMGFSIDLTQYRTDLPWNDPRNGRVTRFGPVYLQCPYTQDGPEDNYASYFYVTDYCTTDRIVIVEQRGAGIAWAEPKDLSLADLRRLLVRSHPGRWSRSEAPGIAVVTSDRYSVSRIRSTDANDFLRQLDAAARR